MNKKQRWILISVAILVIVTFFFPPALVGSSIRYLKYKFLFNLGLSETIYVSLLLVEWIAIGIVGGIGYILCSDRKPTSRPDSRP